MNKKRLSAAELPHAYASHFRSLPLLLPYNFRLLCALLELQPERVLNDFMSELVCAPPLMGLHPQLQDYFVRHGYGRRLYSITDVQKMFREMEAQSMLWPALGSMPEEELEQRLAWRSRFVQEWFDRWLRHSGREAEALVLLESV